MDLTTKYPFVIAMYLLSGLVCHNVTTKPRPFMPGKYAFWGFTWYGLFVATGLFLALLHISRCQLSFWLTVIVFVIPTLIRYLLCQTCSDTYNVTLTYLWTLPLLVLLFECPQISTICTALAIVSAFGRLGCISAGCCRGPMIACHQFHYRYHDINQQPNVERGSDFTCTVPTIIFEAIGQFVIAGFCLMFPKYANIIFGVGTSGMVFVTGFWRKRYWPKLTALMLLLIPIVCTGKLGNPCSLSVAPKIRQSALVAATIAYVLSHDLFKPSLSK